MIQIVQYLVFEGKGYAMRFSLVNLYFPFAKPRVRGCEDETGWIRFAFTGSGL